LFILLKKNKNTIRQALKKLKRLVFSISKIGIQDRDFVTTTDLNFNKGDLGNQLFKYAMIRSYSLLHNVQIVLPDPRTHRLSELKINCNYYDKSIIELYTKNRYNESEFHFNQQALKHSPKQNFKGFFQSEKYFKDIREVLRKDFHLSDNKKEEKALENLKLIRKENTGKEIVSIHVRRGDYVPSKIWYSDGITTYSPDRDLKHPLMPVEYFQEAASEFKNAIFLIFSDNLKDIDWCKKKLMINNAIFTHNDDLIDFKMMQFCDHNIISNSSFSWWPAWLNSNTNKRIISPSKNNWFGEFYADYNMSDLIPNEWKQL